MEEGWNEITSESPKCSRITFSVTIVMKKKIDWKSSHLPILIFISAIKSGDIYIIVIISDWEVPDIRWKTGSLFQDFSLLY